MFGNFISEQFTGTGTNITLIGATTGHIAFSEAFSNGDPVAYVIEDGLGVIKCAGVGTYNTGGAITRNDTWNWNGTTYTQDPGTNITLSGGTHTIRVAETAKQLLEWDGKLDSADATSGNMLISNGTQFNSVPVTGDVTVAADGTMTVGAGGADSILIDGRVNEASGVNKGQPVYITGATGPTPDIALADSSDYSKAGVIALAIEDKNNNQNITVMTNGLLENIDTSAFTSGDVLYLGTVGQLTTTHPIGLEIPHQIGYVIKSNASTGSVLVEVVPMATVASVNGFVRNLVINSSSGTSAIVNNTIINDAGNYVSVNMQGSNSSFGANEGSIYNNGYGKFKFINDGNVGFTWATDVGDTHNNSNTVKMTLSSAGDLDVTGKVSSSTAELGVPNNGNDEPFLQVSDTLVTLGFNASVAEVSFETFSVIDSSFQINYTTIVGTNIFEIKKSGTSQFRISTAGVVTVANNLFIDGMARVEDSLEVADLLTVENFLILSNKFTPASASAPGVLGQACWDDFYWYVCIATNTWKRTGIATWV